MGKGGQGWFTLPTVYYNNNGISIQWVGGVQALASSVTLICGILRQNAIYTLLQS